MKYVEEVEAKDFEQAVLAKSHAGVVVVDFWAEWCAPCRMLGPTLEREVNALAGRVRLAKVDVDRAQELAAAFQVQGIPAVKAFRNGAVVAEFTGARDASFVRRWLSELAPSAMAEALERADTVEALEPLLADAEVGLAAALKLADVHLAAGRADAALELTTRVPPHHALSERAGSVAQRAQLALAASAFGGEAAIRAALASNEADVEAQFALGCALAARGDDEAALEAFLEVVTRRKARRDDARKAMLAVFEKLGSASAVTQTWRRRLQAVL
ncbi:MAG: tetratricopeptide repeat protein [Myxococcaceae bacterium]|nr:tetratricopeptide repeat protein [Myxococcaceae bacterium]